MKNFSSEIVGQAGTEDGSTEHGSSNLKEQKDHLVDQTENSQTFTILGIHAVRIAIIIPAVIAGVASYFPWFYVPIIGATSWRVPLDGLYIIIGLIAVFDYRYLGEIMPKENIIIEYIISMWLFVFSTIYTIYYEQD